jgi:hypothetical protein
MTTEDQYARWKAERATPPPLTSGDTLHWDGLGTVAQDWRLTEDGLPAPPVWRCIRFASEEMSLVLSPASSEIDWVSKAATVTFYLAPVLLRDATRGALPMVTGVLVWVRREGHAASLPSIVSTALLVHAVSLGVVDCNRNGSGLQSAHFPDHIICIYPLLQDRITVLVPFW